MVTEGGKNGVGNLFSLGKSDSNKGPLYLIEFKAVLGQTTIFEIIVIQCNQTLDYIG